MLDKKLAVFTSSPAILVGMDIRNCRRVETGIHVDRWGIRVCVKVGGKQKELRFHPNTKLETLQKARADMRAAMRGQPRRVRRGGDAEEPLNRHEHLFGYKECYVYFVQDGDLIKIGRASDVVGRMSALQTSNPNPLTLLVSARAHDYVERSLHERFKHLRTNREWFRADPELIAFVARVQAGADLSELAEA